MRIRKGINMRLGNYRLTSDSICYTLERVGLNNDEESENFGKEILSFVGYYTSFPNVMYAILEDEIRGCGAETVSQFKDEVIRIEKELLSTANKVRLYKACWCKDCVHYDDKHCLKPESVNYMDTVSEYNSCEHCEREVVE